MGRTIGRIGRAIDPTKNKWSAVALGGAPMIAGGTLGAGLANPFGVQAMAAKDAATPQDPGAPAPFQAGGPRGLMPDPHRVGQMMSPQRGPAPGYAPNPYQASGAYSGGQSPAAAAQQGPGQSQMPGGFMGGFISQMLRRR
jgi:hypothetical protein